MSQLARLVRLLNKEKGTALHVSANAPVRIRVDGRLSRLEVATLSATEIEAEVRSIANDSVWDRIESGQPANFPCEVGGDRYRAHCFMRHGGPTVILRTTANLTTFKELGLPSTVRRLAQLRRGLILIAGPTGSGKSTTVGALLNAVDEGRAKHVVTVESPIELTYSGQRTSISQREVGTHTKSFVTGLRSSLRQGGDVLFTSDIPDEASLVLVLEAVAAGMLVIGTVRAAGAVRALERLVDSPRRRALLNGLGEHLSAVVSLLRLTNAQKHGYGHCVATELLVRSRGAVAALRGDELHALHDVMQRSDAMQTLDDSLSLLVESGRITIEDAFDHARDKQRFHDIRPTSRRGVRRSRER